MSYQCVQNDREVYLKINQKATTTSKNPGIYICVWDTHTSYRGSDNPPNTVGLGVCTVEDHLAVGQSDQTVHLLNILALQDLSQDLISAVYERNKTRLT